MVVVGSSTTGGSGGAVDEGTVGVSLVVVTVVVKGWVGTRVAVEMSVGGVGGVGCVVGAYLASFTMRTTSPCLQHLVPFLKR